MRTEIPCRDACLPPYPTFLIAQHYPSKPKEKPSCYNSLIQEEMQFLDLIFFFGIFVCLQNQNFLLALSCGTMRCASSQHYALCSRFLEEINETSLSWFSHVQRRPINAPIRCCDIRDVKDNIQIKKDKGRPKKTWWGTYKKDTSILGVNENIVSDNVQWRKKIYAADQPHLVGIRLII